MPIPSYSVGDHCNWTGTNADANAGTGFAAAYYIQNPGVVLANSPHVVIQWADGFCTSVFEPGDSRLSNTSPTMAMLPPLLKRASNFVRAMSRALAARQAPLDARAVADRLAVCNGSGSLPACVQRLPGGLCASCGCHLDLKAALATEDCPLGKWPKPASTPPPASA